MLYLVVVNILLYLSLCCLIFFPFRDIRPRKFRSMNSEVDNEWDESDSREEDDESMINGEQSESADEIESEEADMKKCNGQADDSNTTNIVWMAKKCLDLISSADDMIVYDEKVQEKDQKKSRSMFEELLKCLKGKTRSDFYSWDDVLSGRKDSVKILLDRGFSVNGTDREGDSLLHYACKTQDVNIVRKLLEKQSRIMLNKKLESPVHTAVESGNTEITKILLDSGAYVDSADKFGYTPLHIAAKSTEEELLRLLIDYRADIRAKTDSNMEPIHFAVKNSRILEILIGQGVDLNVQTKDGASPLHCATKYNNAQSIEMLIKNKALVNVIDVNGSTPLLVQCKNFSFLSEDNLKCYDCVKILVERGACVNRRDYCGQTPLHFATENELVDIMELLLEFGADPNIISETGDSPLHIAVRNQSLEVVYTLLEWGADINLPGTLEETPLDIAAQSLLMFNVWNYSSEVLVKHIAKLLTAGIEILIDDSLTTLYKKISPEFLKKCSDEVFKLSGKTIANSTSYLDILASSEDKLTKYLRNARVEEMYKRGDYLNMFPLYSSLLTLKFRVGFERNYLMNKSFKLFQTSKYHVPRLPFDCFEKICDYLTVSELKNLSHAYDHSKCTDGYQTGVCTICRGMMCMPKQNIAQPLGSKRFHLIKILNY